MKFFRLRHTIDSKIIGRKYPQVERVLMFENWDEDRFLEYYTGRPAPANVSVPQPILYKGAKLTDLISASAIGLSRRLVISTKMLEILKRLNVSGIQYFKTSVFEASGKEHPYWILHPFEFHYEYLNLQASEMGYYRNLAYTDLLRKVVPENIEALEKEVSYYEKNAPDLFDLNENFSITSVSIVENADSDLFCLNHVQGGVGFYVSEKLKIALSESNCTGMIFTGPNEAYP